MYVCVRSKKHFLKYRIFGVFKRNRKFPKIFEFRENWGQKNIFSEGQKNIFSEGQKNIFLIIEFFEFFSEIIRNTSKISDSIEERSIAIIYCISCLFLGSSHNQSPLIR